MVNSVTPAFIQHGGNLREASTRYQIPFHEWVDLSTGINPNGWIPPEIPAYVWQRLPEDNDGLLEAAQDYYGAESIMPIAGSQAAIQSLPYCRKISRVAIVSPAYAEYAFCWRLAGHDVREIHRQDVAAQLDQVDVLIVINPNNPDTYLHSIETLQHWHHQLAKKGGWLIVDEAFIDSTPEHSLMQTKMDTLPNLIVLRSLGKFFGLAGLRLGFIIANPSILNSLKLRLGSWSISHPARWLGTKALQDHAWQEKTRCQLHQQSQELKQLLSRFPFESLQCTHLFCYFKHKSAKDFQKSLAQQAIWVRRFKQANAIRLGLVNNKKTFTMLEKALLHFSY